MFLFFNIKEDICFYTTESIAWSLSQVYGVLLLKDVSVYIVLICCPSIQLNFFWEDMKQKEVYRPEIGFIHSRVIWLRGLLGLMYR